MERELQAGRPWKDVLESAGRWLPAEDRPILNSSADSGRLVEVLLRLSKKHALLADQRRRAIGTCIYPIIVLHFGALAVPARHLVTGDLDVYIHQTGTVLLPLWGLIVLLAWGARGRHSWFQAAVRLAPLFRAYSRRQALADLAFSLDAQVTAGLSIVNAWENAGHACGDSRLRRAAHRISAAARAGEEPGAALDREKPFPEDFVSLYLTGEKTGRLDENLAHLAEIYTDRAAGSLRAASLLYPKLLFIAVALWVAYTVLLFYAGYFDQLDPFMHD